MLKVLLFTKQNSWCRTVGKFCHRNFDTTWRENPVNFDDYNNKYDYVISYLAPQIIPKRVLDLATIAAINFHPGPPKYPGIGGYNFALYNGDVTYGVVAHLMQEKVDTGMIFDQMEFKIYDTDTVESLKDRSMNALLYLFYAVMGALDGDYVSYLTEDAKWLREPYTRKDLQELCNRWGSVIIEPDEPYAEKFIRWYNACYFPNAQDRPHIEVNGKKYYIIREDHESIPRRELFDNTWYGDWNKTV